MNPSLVFVIRLNPEGTRHSPRCSASLSALCPSRVLLFDVVFKRVVHLRETFPFVSSDDTGLVGAPSASEPTSTHENGLLHTVKSVKAESQ